MARKRSHLVVAGSPQLEVLQHSLSQLIKKKLRSETAGKPVSEATIKMTSNTLSAAIMRLWAMGFHLQSVSQLRSRHCKALAEDWLREGYSVNTIVNNLCRLRRLGHWIGRDDLVPNNAAAIWLNVKRPKPGSSRAKVEIVAAVQDLKQHAPAR